ncbi:hypothetical protein NPIL_140091 [Nephila pilipes]|uniref:Uncharacterized protein n=1 Tax=Nephila pilipes TaxID=299642 RepID=A0A8X6QJK9_NEPPI|nr:hypothetical protein NPIL_140091 [Nephila pilipes]
MNIRGNRINVTLIKIKNNLVGLCGFFFQAVCPSNVPRVLCEHNVRPLLQFLTGAEQVFSGYQGRYSGRDPASNGPFHSLHRLDEPRTGHVLSRAAFQSVRVPNPLPNRGPLRQFVHHLPRAGYGRAEGRHGQRDHPTLSASGEKEVRAHFLSQVGRPGKEANVGGRNFAFTLRTAGWPVHGPGLRSLSLAQDDELLWKAGNQRTDAYSYPNPGERGGRDGRHVPSDGDAIRPPHEVYTSVRFLLLLARASATRSGQISAHRKISFRANHIAAEISSYQIVFIFTNAKLQLREIQ